MTYFAEPYIWRAPSRYYANSKILDYKYQERVTERLIFMQGRPLPFDMKNDNFPYTLQDPSDYDLILDSEVPIEKLLEYDCLPNNMAGGPPIVNLKVLNFLKEFCPNDFQYFPVVIRNESKKIPDFENHDYYLINVTKLVDSIDKEKSYVQKTSYGLTHIKKLIFKPDCMGEVHLAREIELSPLLIVSSELAKAFKKEKIKGVRFMTGLECYNSPFPEEYLYHMYFEDPDAAKRFFVTQLNVQKNYEFLKTRVHKMPPEILKAIIEMTLSKSSFHEKQCAELLEMIKQKS